MSARAAWLFQQPSEVKLTKAIATASARALAFRGEAGNDPAIVLPDIVGGRADEESSMSMNDVMTDTEAAFDDIYLNYPRHKTMQLAIDRIRQHGLKVRGTGKPMRGLLITGPTASGKTTGIEEYAAHLNREVERQPDQRPILYLRLRKKVTVVKLLRAILNKFGDRYALRRNEDELIIQVRNCIQRAAVEVIVIDECQHLRNKSTDNMEVTDQLKTFLDDCIAPVVFVGTDDAQGMFSENLQLSGRCAEPIRLAPLDAASLQDVALLTKFLDLLDEQMVARKLTEQSSKLATPYVVTCLHLASGGVIGQAYRIVRAALLIATSRRAPCVEQYDLSLAIERWAMRNGVCSSNPFRSAELRQLEMTTQDA